MTPNKKAEAPGEAGKPTTDLNKLLGSARRAQDVPRPQVATPAPAQPAHTSEQEPEKEMARRINITLNAAIHRRMKILSAERGTRLQPLVDEVLEAYLKTQGR
ncbi:hypothetical protein [Deinococcus fonticola]|uniref:hypothetical protein n=1 Tax=Deinococcus fonticola TaxID=2528713 RepID=UPI001075326D|nr:hypothetical protein [Deinococcus fonticola]